MRHALHWLTVVALGMIVLGIIGLTMDRITEWISYFHLYAPGELFHTTLVYGTPLLLWFAALETVRPIRTRLHSHLLLAVLPFIMAVFGFGIGGIGYLAVKMGLVGQFQHIAIPSGRFFFCQGLVVGAWITALVYYVAYVYAWIRSMQRASS